MKNKVAIVLLILTSSFCFGQIAAKIQFKAQDNTIDYGTTSKSKDNGIRVFEFTNTGTAPLIITNVLSTCSCIVATKPITPIMPGKTGKIEVQYSMIPGPIRKTITVESNATNYEAGRIALKIKGDIIID
jgi:hypothetical protein